MTKIKTSAVAGYASAPCVRSRSESYPSPLTTAQSRLGFPEAKGAEPGGWGTGQLENQPFNFYRTGKTIMLKKVTCAIALAFTFQFSSLALPIPSTPNTGDAVSSDSESNNSQGGQLGSSPSVCNDSERISSYEQKHHATARLFDLFSSGSKEGIFGGWIEDQGFVSKAGVCVGKQDSVVLYIDNNKVQELSKFEPKFFALIPDSKDKTKELYRRISPFQSALSSTDRLELYLLQPTIPSSDKKHPKLKESSSFPIRAYGSRTPILGHVTVTGEKLLGIRDSFLSATTPGFLQYLCHHPIYGLRFYRGANLLAETSICFHCNNFYALKEGRYYWMALADLSEDFQKRLEELLPIPAEIKNAN